MAQLRDILNRFRPAAAPGSGGLAGVPADHDKRLAAEIDPVLGLLAETHERCIAIAAEAEREAVRITRDAADRAAIIVADGRARAARARDEAAGEIVKRAQAQAAANLRAAAEAAHSRRMPDDAELSVLVQVAMDLVTSRPGP